jgi:hypothetical protein
MGCDPDNEFERPPIVPPDTIGSASPCEPWSTPLSKQKIRSRTSPAVIPRTSTTFDRDVAPPTIVTARFATLSAFASTSTTASFAAPSTGGAFTRTLSASPCTPSMPARLERGCTRTANRTAGSAPARWVIVIASKPLAIYP